jgi:hypothetical protein
MRRKRPVYDMGKACRDEAQIDKRQKPQASKNRRTSGAAAGTAVT